MMTMYGWTFYRGYEYVYNELEQIPNIFQQTLTKLKKLLQQLKEKLSTHI
jgi:hypothetical protein